MVNTNCEVCGIEFQIPRRGKLYCSEECKQKAYYERQKEKEDGQAPGSLTTNKNEILYTFNYSEYLEVSKKIPGLKSNGVELFCFLRKNLPKDASVEFIITYIENIDWENFWNDQKIMSLFDKFKEEFHTGKVIVYNKDQNL